MSGYQPDYNVYFERDQIDGALRCLDEYGYCGIRRMIDADWVEELKIARLGDYGITHGDLDRIVDAANNRNNPIALTPSEIKTLLEARL